MSPDAFISLKKAGFTALIILLTACFVAGCQPSATETTGGDHDASDHDHASDHDASDHDHEDDHEPGSRLPNDGAVVRIVSPADGTAFASGEDIVVEIEVENFDLTAGGNHWHLYVDGKVLSMLAGGTTKTVIRDLEPGKHQIDAYLGLTTHEELEDGASVTITVTE